MVPLRDDNAADVYVWCAQHLRSAASTSLTLNDKTACVASGRVSRRFAERSASLPAVKTDASQSVVSTTSSSGDAPVSDFTCCLSSFN